MMDLKYYSDKFSNLSVKVTAGEKNPNKAILLICMIDLIRCGYITINIVPINDVIEESFQRTWRMYVGNNPPSVWTPFWHLKTDGFWHFRPINSAYAIESLVPPGQTASKGAMRSEILYAYFDEDLFSLLSDSHCRDCLVTVLKETFSLNY